MDTEPPERLAPTREQESKTALAGLVVEELAAGWAALTGVAPVVLHLAAAPKRE